MMVLENLYDPENTLVDAIRKLFVPKLMYSKDTASTLDAQVLADVENDDHKIAVVVELMGYIPKEQPQGGATPSAQMQLEWRITLVTPSELYNTLSGATMVSVISRVIALKCPKSHRSIFKLIPDKHHSHKPEFDTSLTAIHATFGYNAIIKPHKKD